MLFRSNQGTGLGWDTLGRLVSTRSSLVSRVATREPAAKDVLSRVEYDSQGRAYALVDQPAEVGAASARREITFPAVSEQVVKDFIANGGSGVTASVRLANTAPYRLAMTYELNPQEWTTISARDAGSLSKSTEVDPKTGRLAQTLDEQGRAYRYEYDDRGLVTTTKGPFLGGQGARAAGDGIVTTSEYDTRRVNGQDQALVGLRAQVYSKVQFGGDVASEFWAAKPSDGGLSGAWAGRPADFSVQAAGVWVPSDTEDVLGANQGWQFRLSASTDAEVTFVIGGSVCLVNVICTVKGLPKGPKSVSIQIARAASSGFFAVEAAPMGMVLHSIPTAEVGPGYALVSNQTTNDILVGKESQTRYDYADPASGRPSQVVAPGNLVTSFGYEANRSGRLITRTTPGGSVQTTDYWPLSGHATLPSPCTGTAVAAGLPRSITRPDGVKLTQYQDIRGRLIASVNGTGADAEITCISYRADSSVLSTSIYGPGGLIESTTSDEAFDGDPRVGAVTTTHGDAAPVDPGGSVTSSVRVNLLGQAVLSVDMSGTTTQTTYDNLGNATRVVQTSSTGQSITFEYAYRAVDGLLASQKVNGVVAATMAYDGTTGRLTSITYPDGVRSSYSYFGSGALNGVTVTTGDERFTRISQTLGRAAAGRIESQSLTVRGTAATTENRVYTYDASGRLTRTVITTDGKRSTFGYRYGDQDASCGSSYAAGKDNLRTSGSRNDVSFANCYSSGGRLVSTTDPALGGSAEVSYDALGRVTGVTGPRALALTWATDTTLADVTETGADGFVRSTFDTYGGSILDKTVTTDAGSTTLRYAGPFLLAVSGDAPTGLAATQYGLPGGATVTIDAGKQAVLDIAGADGSALATVAVPSLGAGSAAETGLAARFGSYGEPLVTPTDTSAIPSYTWKAMSRQETLPGTSSITLMGARPYHPWLGQFLAPDPNVDAGNNAYSYTNADPINQSDSSGREADALDWVARSLGAATFLLGLVGGGAAARIAMKGNILTGAKVAAWVGAVGAVTGVAATATQIVSMATSSSSVSWDQWVVSIGSGILSIVAVGGAVAGYRMYRAQKAWQQTVWNARNPVEAIRARTDPARELAYLPSKMKSGAKRHRQRFGVQFADQQSGGSLTQVNVVENMKSETFRNAYRKEDEAVFKFDSDSGIDNGRSLRNTRPDIFE